MIFEPKGEEPRWKPVYRLFKDAASDEVVTYDEIGEVLGMDAYRDRSAIQNVVHQASKRLLEDLNIALENVRSKGYRVATQVQHHGLAHGQQKKARRRLKAGHALVVHTDLNGMDPQERVKVETARRLIAAQLDFNRRTDLKLKDHDEALGLITQRQDRSEEENASIRERLARLEARLAESQ